jgi:hypothetical protein
LTFSNIFMGVYDQEAVFCMFDVSSILTCFPSSCLGFLKDYPVNPFTKISFSKRADQPADATWSLAKCYKTSKVILKYFEGIKVQLWQNSSQSYKQWKQTRDYFHAFTKKFRFQLLDNFARRGQILPPGMNAYPYINILI